MEENLSMGFEVKDQRIMMDDLLEADHLKDENEADLSSCVCNDIKFLPIVSNGFGIVEFVFED